MSLKTLRKNTTVWRLTLVISCLVLLVCLYQAYDYYKSSCFSCLPTGVLTKQLLSPDQKNTLKIYRIESEAMQVSDAIRAEVQFNNGEKRNILYQSRQSDAEVKWIDNDTVVINGIQLNIWGSQYDSRTADPLKHRNNTLK